MTVVTNALSVGITNWDTNPANIPLTGYQGIYANTAGEGAVWGPNNIMVDQLPVSTAFLGASGNYGRVARIPANAKIQCIRFGTDKILDTANPQTLAFDISVGFSDALNDGTAYYLQGQVPSQTLPATTANLVAANAATRNKLFGLVTLSANGGTTTPIALTELTQNVSGGTGGYVQSGVTLSTGSTVLSMYNIMTTSLVRLFGMLTGQGIAIDNTGWMDFIVNVTVAATTAQAGNIIFQVDYLV
jgi:hypothetical protein